MKKILLPNKKNLFKAAFFLSPIIFLLLFSISASAQWINDPAVNNPISTAKNNQDHPQGIPDGNGGAFICWSSHTNGGLLGDIYAQHIDKNGTAQWAINGIAICTSGNNSEYPQIISDGNGGAIIAWIDHRNQSTTNTNEQDVYAQRVDVSGTSLWRQNGVAIDSNANAKNNISMIEDGTGGAFLTWDEFWQGNYNGIFEQHINSAGLLQWGSINFPNKISYPTTNEAFSPKMVSDGRGGFIVTWYDNSQYDQDDIYAQRINAAGQTQWEYDDLSVCGADGDQTLPQITTDGHKGAIITWQDGRSTNFNVYASRLDSNGIKKWLNPQESLGFNNGIPICATPGDAFPQVETDGIGGAYFAWADGRAGTYPLYLQHVDANGDTSFQANGIKVADAINYGGDVIGNEVPDAISLLKTENNGVIVTWPDERNGNSNDDIYSQSVDINGNFLWTPGGVPVCTAAEGQEFVQMVPGDNNGAIAFWQDSRNSTTTDDDIYASLLNINGTLPVTFTRFYGTYTAPDANLFWQTQTEINFDHFEIERSNDGKSFEKIGVVNGNGNSESAHSYNFTDTNVHTGINYYRLKIVDIDGHFTYSSIITITANTQLLVKILGNPVRNNINLEISGTNGKALPVWITDASGRKYKSFITTDGSKQINIDDLASGIYFLSYQSENGLVSIPFNKQ